MDTLFEPRKELFRPCCGHCIFGMKRKSTDDLGMRKVVFKCKKSDKIHSYGHICDVTSTDDGEQLSIFDGGADES